MRKCSKKAICKTPVIHELTTASCNEYNGKFQSQHTKPWWTFMFLSADGRLLGGKKRLAQYTQLHKPKTPLGSLKCHDTSNYCLLWSGISVSQTSGAMHQRIQNIPKPLSCTVSTTQGFHLPTPLPSLLFQTLACTAQGCTQMENCGRY